ncbi:hypothetical protein M422DRAFT_41370 [Sphaerobolus stellatus SS14]|nr:hypothetical protein M422DRAFT_41370 [Sphaerobolus stellatus SS14]
MSPSFCADRRLEIRVDPEDGAWSIWTKSNAHVEIGETLVRIPKGSVFSRKTCSYARELDAYFERDRNQNAGVGVDDQDDATPSLQLALAFLIEENFEPLSPWHAYFQSLPTQTAQIAVFWGTTGDQDGIEARSWLRGTEAGKILDPPHNNKPGLLACHFSYKDRINEFYNRVVEPVLERLGGVPTAGPSPLQRFHRAYSLVSSRAFIVDAYFGLSLVPVADIFNHVENNHVHLESDYHVCPLCGSLEECEHDLDPKSTMSAHIGDNAPDTCEMVANASIGPGEEIYNTYESGLTNARLLCHYGFALEGNEHDVVKWTAEEVIEGLTAKPERILELWGQILAQWPGNEDWDESQLVFSPERDDGPEGCGESLGSQHRLERVLELNADGQISHQLWLLVFVLALDQVDRDGAMYTARDVCQTQLWMEKMVWEDAEDPGSSTTEHTDRHRGAAPLLVRRIAEFVVEICERKIRSAYDADLEDGSIGDMLDGLQPH